MSTTATASADDADHTAALLEAAVNASSFMQMQRAYSEPTLLGASLAAADGSACARMGGGDLWSYRWPSHGGSAKVDVVRGGSAGARALAEAGRVGAGR